jgi:hypothetical protein
LLLAVVAAVVLLIGGGLKWQVWRAVNRIFRETVHRRTTTARASASVARSRSAEHNGPTTDRTQLSTTSAHIKPHAQRETATMVPADSAGDLSELRWSREQIRALRARVSNQTILTLYELAKDRDGEPVNYLELMRATGRSAAQVRADFSGFSRIANAIHDAESWPILPAEPTDGESQRAYVVPGQYLEWWFES